MKKINLKVSEAYVPFFTVEKLFEFDAQIDTALDWTVFEQLDNDLSVASNDYVRADFATYDEDDNGEVVKVYGVSIVAHYATIANIFAAADVLDCYGYHIYLDEDLIPNPDSDLVYWEG